MLANYLQISYLQSCLLTAGLAWRNKNRRKTDWI